MSACTNGLSAWDARGCRCITSRARSDPSRCGTTPNPVGSRCRTTLGWDAGAFVGVHKPFVGVHKCLSAWDSLHNESRSFRSKSLRNDSQPRGESLSNDSWRSFNNDFFSGFFAKSREHLSSTWLLAKGLERFLEQMDHASRDFAFFFSLLILAKT